MKREEEVHLDNKENQLNIKTTTSTKIYPKPRKDASLFIQMENQLRKPAA